VEHPGEELLRVLFDGDVHLEGQGERSAVGVLRIGIALVGPFGQPAGFPSPVDLFEDGGEAHPLILEFAREALQCRRCKLSCHGALRFGRAR